MHNIKIVGLPKAQNGQQVSSCPKGYYYNAMFKTCLPITELTTLPQKEQAQLKASNKPIPKDKNYGKKVDPYETIIAKETAAKQSERNQDLAKRAGISAAAAAAIVSGGAALPYVAPALETTIAGVPGLTAGNLLNSYFAYEGAKNIPNVYNAWRQVGSKPTWSNIGNAAGETVVSGINMLPFGMSAYKGIPSVMQDINQAGEYLTTQTPLKDAYKINPWAFKPNPEAYYRMIGQEGYADALESGLLRSNPGKGGLQTQQFDDVYFSMKHPWDGRNYGYVTKSGEPIGGVGYKGPYMAELTGQELNHPISSFPRANMAQSKVPISLENPGLKLYKQDWLRGYKEIPKPKSLSSSVENIAQPWTMQELPGLHLKSTMSNGPISKIVEPKTGLINVDQALAIIAKESGGKEKADLVRKAFGENLPKKMDYNDFRKTVQDQLVDLNVEVFGKPLPKTKLTKLKETIFPSKIKERPFTADYRIEHLGWVKDNPVANSNNQWFSKFNLKNQVKDIDRTILHNNEEIKQVEELLKTTTDSNELNKLNAKLVNLKQNVYKSNLYKNDLLYKLENDVNPESKTILFSNKDKFGVGSSSHNNFQETLGHAHYYTDPLDTGSAYITQIQSDPFQLYNWKMPQVQPHLRTKAGWTSQYGHSSIPFPTKLTKETALDHITKMEESLQNKVAYLKNNKQGWNGPKFSKYEKQSLQKEIDELKEYIELRNNDLKNWDQKELLGKSFNERYFQELLNHFGKSNENISKIKLPSVETLERQQNWAKFDDAQKQTILKEYKNLYKFIEKNYGTKLEKTFDRLGNSWHNFEIPESFKQGKGEIKAFKEGGLYKAQDGLNIPGVTDFKMTPPASESTSHSFYNPMLGRATSTATAGQSKQAMAASTADMGRGKKAERDAEARRVAERKAAKAIQDGQAKTFTFPTGETKSLDDMNWREREYVAGKSLEARGRINEDEEAWYDMLNPVSWYTDMAGALGTSPYEAQQSDSNMPYASAIVNPLLMGRMMGSGSINPISKKFWTNEVSNPEFLNSVTGGVSGMTKGLVDRIGASRKFSMPPDKKFYTLDMGSGDGYNTPPGFKFINGPVESPKVLTGWDTEVPSAAANTFAPGFKTNPATVWPPRTAYTKGPVVTAGGIGGSSNVPNPNVIIPDSDWFANAVKSDNLKGLNPADLIQGRELGQDIAKGTGGFNKGVYDLERFPGYVVKFEDPQEVSNAMQFPEYKNYDFVKATESIDHPNIAKVHHQFTMPAGSGREGQTALIMNKVTGVPLSKLTPMQIRKIPKEAIEELYNSFKKLRNNKLGFDFQGDNLVYDPVKKQFGIYDIESNFMPQKGQIGFWDWNKDVLGGSNLDIYGVDQSGQNLKNAFLRKLRTGYENASNKFVNDWYSSIPGQHYSMRRSVTSGSPAGSRPKFLEAISDQGKLKAVDKVKDILAAMHHYRRGGMITDPMGQWAHPGQNTRIPGNNITMQGVPYPVLAKASNGMTTMMYPGQEYHFPGASHVDEYPMMEEGGWLEQYQTKGQVTLPPIYTDDPADIRYYLRQLQYNADSLKKYNQGEKEYSDLLKLQKKHGVTKGFPATYNFPLFTVESVGRKNYEEIFGGNLPIQRIGFNIGQFDDPNYQMHEVLEARRYKKPQDPKNIQTYILKPKPKPEEPSLKKKVTKMEPIPFTSQSSMPQLRTMQQPNIELPAVQRGQYRTSYYDPQMKDWNERAFMTQQESDQFADEMSKRGYPGAYGNITQRVQYKFGGSELKNGGWLNKYQIAGQVTPPIPIYAQDSRNLQRPMVSASTYVPKPNVKPTKKDILKKDRQNDYNNSVGFLKDYYTWAAQNVPYYNNLSWMDSINVRQKYRKRNEPIINRLDSEIKVLKSQPDPNYELINNKYDSLFSFEGEPSYNWSNSNLKDYTNKQMAPMYDSMRMAPVYSLQKPGTVVYWKQGPVRNEEGLQGSFNGNSGILDVSDIPKENSNRYFTLNHELAHKADLERRDPTRAETQMLIHDIRSGYINPSGGVDLKYLSDWSERQARHRNTQLWLKHNMPGFNFKKEMGDKEYNFLKQNINKIPFDIKQLLDLYGYKGFMKYINRFDEGGIIKAQNGFNIPGVTDFKMPRVVSESTSLGTRNNKTLNNQKIPVVQQVVNQNPEYIVKAGDTLSKIASAYNTTPMKLAQYNNIDNPNVIGVNQKIKIPVAKQIPQQYQDWETIKQRNQQINLLPDEEKIISYYSNRPDDTYLVVDKKNAKMNLYKGNKLLKSYEVGVGANPGDAQTVTRLVNGKTDWTGGNKSTGAGVYTISHVDPKSHEYFDLPAFNLKNDQGLEVATTIHGTPLARRARFDNNNILDNRMSNGCINGKCFDLQDMYGKVDVGSKVYILPEDEGNQFQIVDGKPVLKVNAKNRVKYNEYIDQTGQKRKGQGVNQSINTLQYKPIMGSLDKKLFENNVYQTNDFNDDDEYTNTTKPYFNALINNKQKIMEATHIPSDVYNDIAKMSFGIYGTESNFGDTHSALGNFGRAVGKWWNPSGSSSPDYNSKATTYGANEDNRSVGLTQMRWSYLNKDEKDALTKLGITSNKDLLDPEKAAIATTAVLAIRYNQQLTDQQKKDMWKYLPTKWNKRSNYASRVKNNSDYVKFYQLDDVKKNGGQNNLLKKYQFAGQPDDPIYYNVSMAPLSDNSSVRMNTKFGPKNLVSTATTVSGLYGAINAQPKQEGRGEMILNTTGKFLDPTGISSWGDAGESIGKAYDDPGIINILNAAVSTAGALPLIHYLGATGKALTNTNKVTQQAANLNKLQKAKKYALQTAHFVSGEPVINVVDKVTRASRLMPNANKLLTTANKSNRFWNGIIGYTNAASVPNQKYGGQNNWLNNYK